MWKIFKQSSKAQDKVILDKKLQDELIPNNWCLEDKLETGHNPYIVTIKSIAPDRKSIIALDVYRDLYEFDSQQCAKFKNVSIQNRLLTEKMTDWQAYNEALAELQKRFGV